MRESLINQEIKLEAETTICSTAGGTAMQYSCMTAVPSGFPQLQLVSRALYSHSAEIRKY